MRREKIPHEPCLFRKRWYSEYLVDLAVKEGTFTTEYRVNPRGFDELLHFLTPSLTVIKNM
jgi:hypothetical protein